MKSDRPRTVLATSERSRILIELSRIIASTEVVQEHLLVASRRSGAEVSGWTSERLDRLLEASRDLQKQVEKTPLSAD